METRVTGPDGPNDDVSRTVNHPRDIYKQFTFLSTH